MWSSLPPSLLSNCKIEQKWTRKRGKMPDSLSKCSVSEGYVQSTNGYDSLAAFF